MLRTNLNSSLIIVIILIIVTLSAGLHYHLKAERTKQENQFVKLGNYNESVSKRIDLLQELQQALVNNVNEFHVTIANYQNSLMKLKAENNLVNVDMKKLTQNVSFIETENEQNTVGHYEQLISLQNTINTLKKEQAAKLNVLSCNLLVLESMLEQNETDFTGFISKFGTRKMKKNLPTIETENPDLTKN